jgi:hypothetical protein
MLNRMFASIAGLHKANRHRTVKRRGFREINSPSKHGSHRLQQKSRQNLTRETLISVSLFGIKNRLNNLLYRFSSTFKTREFSAGERYVSAVPS